MKIRVLSQLISLVLLVLLIALLGACGADRVEDQVDQKLDQVEESIENAVEPPVSPDVTQNPAGLSEKEAQDIALAHAGFTADQVTGLHSSFDLDDGVPEYEVSFYQNGWEYDYTIHADTGDILEYDKDND
ncbi:MAG: PepSY domain-containing protein [Ruminiclostridium sp.]|nr:PepSY domain-containing protein [Ruminiclostridium sp.]